MIKIINIIMTIGANHSSSVPLTVNNETAPSISSNENKPTRTIKIAITNPTF